MDDGPIQRTDQIIEPVDGPVSKSQLGEMSFSEEPIDIVVHESTDPNAENPVMVYCNGVPQFFLRGRRKPSSASSSKSWPGRSRQRSRPSAADDGRYHCQEVARPALPVLDRPGPQPERRGMDSQDTG